MRLKNSLSIWFCGLGFTASILVAAPNSPQGGAGAAAAPGISSLVTGGQIADLSAFGPINTIAEATKTLEAAIAKVQADGGGTILIPANAPRDWVPANQGQEIVRTPAPPAPARSWIVGPGVTLLDARNQRLVLPQVKGMTVTRTFSLQPGDSSPHWQYHPMLPVKNNVVRGTSDFEGWILEAVAKGKDQRFYLESLQGVFPGQTLEIQAARPGGKAPGSVKVKQLGYDVQKRCGYFVADAETPLSAGATLAARTVLSTVKSVTRANNELQTFDFLNRREHYSQGDSYLFSGRLFYTGNEYSPREEPADMGAAARSGYGSAIYSARVIGETNIFRAKVESVNAANNEIRYAEAANAQTLATGRALINLNPRKWIAEGSAYVNYPAGASLGWAASVRSKDAPWTDEVVGRYFALDDPSEYVPGGDKVRRWFQIVSFSTEASGIKCLTLRQYWWGAKVGGIPRLYNEKNFTLNEKEPVLMKYIIAPGSYVNDVTDGLGASERESTGAGKRAFRIAPYGEKGTRLDFAKGDPVEQAIGESPFKPIPFRAWLFDTIPGEFPSPVFDVGNMSDVPRSAVLSVGGSGKYGSVLATHDAVYRDGIKVTGDVSGALMVIRQKEIGKSVYLPGIQWRTDANGNTAAPFVGRSNLNRTLTIRCSDGSFVFDGGVDFCGRSAVGVKSLTGARPEANKINGRGNFRGIALPVSNGATEYEVTFPDAESTDAYVVKIQTNWLTESAVAQQTVNGFRVRFDAPAPEGARLGWLLVR